jgi:hypothetical protein
MTYFVDFLKRSIEYSNFLSVVELLEDAEKVDIDDDSEVVGTRLEMLIVDADMDCLACGDKLTGAKSFPEFRMMCIVLKVNASPDA